MEARRSGKRDNHSKSDDSAQQNCARHFCNYFLLFRICFGTNFYL